MNYLYASTTSKVTVNTNAFDAILMAGPVVQLTLLVLIGMSIMCWAVALSKYKMFKKVEGNDELFYREFNKMSSLDSLFDKLDLYKNSTFALIFAAGYQELQKLAEMDNDNSQEDSPRLTGVDNLERVLRKSIDSQMDLMESRLTILASTGGVGPFIGLFGTVWGIMDSFQKIGQTGSASLAVVAPGISEALVATAIGLLAAIPAVMLYNQFNSRLRKQEIKMNNFASDFLNITKRNFFREK